MAKLNLYVGNAALDKAILSVHKSGQNLQKELHKVACSVLSHLIEHGDVRPVMKLLQAMPKVARVNTLRDWFETFGPVTIEGDNAIFNREGKRDLEGGIAKPFWTMTPEPARVKLDPLKVLVATVKKFEKDAEEFKVDHSLIIKALKYQIEVLSNPTEEVEAEFVEIVSAPLMLTAH